MIFLDANMNIKQKGQRHSLRLKGYDYSQSGAYFLTLVTYQRENLFGRIDHGKMEVNSNGEIIRKLLVELPQYYPGVIIAKFAIMPNHIHTILNIINPASQTKREGAKPDSRDIKGSSQRSVRAKDPRRSLSHDLSEIVRGYKSFTSREINHLRKMPGIPVWQRSYYDHIIWNEEELRKLWDYIDTNPQAWQEDEFY